MPAPLVQVMQKVFDAMVAGEKGHWQFAPRTAALSLAGVANIGQRGKSPARSDA